MWTRVGMWLGSDAVRIAVAVTSDTRLPLPFCLITLMSPP